MRTRILAAGMAGALLSGPAAATNGYLSHGYGAASKAMAAQSTGHYMIVLLIVVGNILYYMIRRLRARQT